VHGHRVIWRRPGSTPAEHPADRAWWSPLILYVQDGADAQAQRGGRVWRLDEQRMWKYKPCPETAPTMETAHAARPSHQLEIARRRTICRCRPRALRTRQLHPPSESPAPSCRRRWLAVTDGAAATTSPQHSLLSAAAHRRRDHAVHIDWRQPDGNSAPSRRQENGQPTPC